MADRLGRPQGAVSIQKPGEIVSLGVEVARPRKLSDGGIIVTNKPRGIADDWKRSARLKVVTSVLLSPFGDSEGDWPFSQHRRSVVGKPLRPECWGISLKGVVGRERYSPWQELASVGI